MISALNEITHPHTNYLQLGNSKPKRLKAYRALFDAHMDHPLSTSIHASTNGNYVLGDNRFQQQIARELGCRVTPGKPGRPEKWN